MRRKEESVSQRFGNISKTLGKGNGKVICNHCGGNYPGSSMKGTTHLKNHLESMKCRAKKNGDLAKSSSVIDLINNGFDALRKFFACSLPFARFGPDFYCFVTNILLIYTYRWEVTKIDGLRECVDYAYKTSSNKLQRAVNYAKIMGKNVFFVDAPYLYEPFDYLKVAVGSKEAFSELEKIDPDFISINLTKQKWNEATATFEHFNALKEICESLRLTKQLPTMKAVDILKTVLFNRSEDCHLCKYAPPQIKEFF